MTDIYSQDSKVYLIKPPIIISLYFILFLLPTIAITAQDKVEKITYQQEAGFFEEQKFVSTRDLVFQTFEETKSLFKLDLTDLLLRLPSISLEGYAFSNTIELAYEQKLSPAFSINNIISIAYSIRNDNRLIRSGEKNSITGGIGIQPRWYYNMKKRIAKNQTANNVSGNYIGAGIEFNYTHGNAQFQSKHTDLSLKFGIQRRIFGKGFIDIQIGPHFSILDYSDTHYSISPEWPLLVTVNNDSKYFWFSSRIRLGITLNQPRLSLDAAQRCNVFQCFKEKKSMFKIDFWSLLNMKMGINPSKRNNKSISGSLVFGFEQKIGTFWSINSEFNLSYDYSKNTHRILFTHIPFSLARLKFTVDLKTQIRYFYNLRRRIAKGKSANNLSGNYFGLEVSTSDLFIYSKYYSSPYKSVKQKFNIVLTLSPVWGIQRTIFKRGYIDYTLGFKLFTDGDRIFSEFTVSCPFQCSAPTPFTIRSINTRPALISPDGFHFSPFSRLRIGLAF